MASAKWGFYTHRERSLDYLENLKKVHPGYAQVCEMSIKLVSRLYVALLVDQEARKTPLEGVSHYDYIMEHSGVAFVPARVVNPRLTYISVMGMMNRYVVCEDVCCRRSVP